MSFSGNKLKLIIGCLIGAVFLYLSFRNVNFTQMWEAFTRANYWYMLAVLAVMFISHYLRVLRWRVLLDPIKRLDIGSLFSSLIIGYMANAFTPAHLGELLRAYVLGKKRGVSASSALATIVVKRILLKKSYDRIRRPMDFLMRPLPGHLREKVWEILERFVEGIVPLKSRGDYPVVVVLSLLIWVCYGFIFHLTLLAFDFYSVYHLPWMASLILLVITTIGIVVPSSPGYVGTYHYLCQVSLALFGVPAGPALSYATAVHAISFAPVLIAGLILSYYEGLGFMKSAPSVDSH